jgi:uncharacterized membrane protein YfcA
LDVIGIAIASLLASLLTFFSGFGLGTILLPVFAIWFSVEMAVAMTAIVHFLNNLFKLVLVGSNIDRNVLIRFGVPAIFAAFFGAYLLIQLTVFVPLYTYEWGQRTYHITPIKLLMSLIMFLFIAFEVVPRLKKIEFEPKYLGWGGVLSGFFGGLSGHQGALRSAFLVRTNLSKEAFIATGTAIACLVDFMRLGVYFRHFNTQSISAEPVVLTLATFSAFVGAYMGNRILKKITMDNIQFIVSIGLALLAMALGLGLI